MARWDGRRRSDNVRRSGGQAVGLGVLFMLVRFIFSRFGILGVIVAVGGIAYLQWQHPQLISSVLGGGSSSTTEEVGAGEYDDEIMAIVASTEDVWTKVFRDEGLGDYPEPQVNIFSGSVDTACGRAPAAVGPFYCPADKQVYFDTSFFKQLETRFGASGDFPRAYVIAHEVGHHVQTVTGTSSQVRQAQSQMSKIEGNQMQVRMELQADCFAGLWAFYERRQALEPGDIEEALRAAEAIGDDALQGQAGGDIKPETFTHGTSEQRQRWFYRGFEAGQYRSCDTFNMPYAQL